MNILGCHENDAEALLHNREDVLESISMKTPIYILLLGLMTLAFIAPATSHAQRVKKIYTNSVTTTTNSPIVATSPP